MGRILARTTPKDICDERFSILQQQFPNVFPGCFTANPFVLKSPVAHTNGMISGSGSANNKSLVIRLTCSHHRNRVSRLDVFAGSERRKT